MTQNLPTTLQQLYAQIDQVTEDNLLNYHYFHFWGHNKKEGSKDTKACLSQWYAAGFELEGVKYETAEHFMMAQKALLFDNKDIFEQIIADSNPARVKVLGRQVTGFDEDKWAQKRFDIVLQGNVAKFSQNPALKEFLLRGCLATIPEEHRDKHIIFVEASPFDKIWGIGLAESDVRAHNPLQWMGKNLLGFVLTRVRQILLAEEAAQKQQKDWRKCQHPAPNYFPLLIVMWWMI